MIKVQYLFLSA